MSNSNLTNAKKTKCDEFYTQLTDIEKELQYYDFSGKSIYCNCDNPQYSNFYKYFKDNFQKLNITHLYCTVYNKDGFGYYGEYDGTEEILKPLNDNGDFRNEECINILKIADVIVTNPPFSLFRPYVKLLMDYNKKFLIIGNKNAVTYKEIFPYIKNNELCLGNTIPNEYYLPNGDITKTLIGLCRWFTNIPHINTKQPLILTKTYNPENYPHYDNYDAINVNKVKDIPIDYDGVMGVLITFLDKYCPTQFEIVGMSAGNSAVNHFGNSTNYVKQHNDRGGCGVINGERVYARFFIKRRL